MPIPGYISPMQKIINDLQAKKAADAAKAQQTAQAQTTTTTPTTVVTPAKTVIPATPFKPYNAFEQLIGKQDPILAQQMYESRTGTIIIPSKTTTGEPTVTPAKTVIPTTPFKPYNAFEQVIGKQDPILAQQMYESRTGTIIIPSKTTTGEPTVTPAKTVIPTTPFKPYNAFEQVIQSLPEEKLIYERQQEIHGPYTPTGARQVAIQQLEKENILKEGYGGVTTIRKTPTIASTGYEKYGYQPESYTYSTILGEMQTSEDILKSNIEASKQAGASLSTTQKYLTEGRTSLENIRNAPETATIYITELDESGKEKEVGYTKSEAITKYEDYLSGIESSYASNKELAGRQIEFENELKRLGAEETTLQAYKQAGYKATLNEKGELILSTPKASEVVEGIYSQEQLQGLYTAQSMRSLGLGTIGSVIQYDVVGLISGKEEAEKIRAGEKERLAEGILGSTKQVGESNIDFTGRFWTSPEVAMDVYLPIATLGAGAALSFGGKALAGTRIGTAVITGASKSSTLVTVGRALSSTAGQVAVVGGIVAMQEAPIVIETAINRPEMLGSTIGRATYDVGMNLTSFTVGAEVGSKAYDVLAPTMRQGYAKTVNLIRSTTTEGELEHPVLAKIYGFGEKTQYNITKFKVAGMQTEREAVVLMVPTVTASARGIEYDLKAPGDLKNIMKYEGERIGSPTIREAPIKTFSQEYRGKRITYDVKTGQFTTEQIHPVASARPFTKEATEFKPPENKPRTAYEIKTKQEPLNVNLQEKYNLQGKTTQQKIEYYGKGKTYLVAKEEDYFLKPGDVTATELERVQSLKGTRPLRYGETKIVERQPSPDLLEKFKASKKDIAGYDLQTEQAGKKLVEWKPKQTGELKQYELQGDTVARVNKGKTVTDVSTGKTKLEIPTRQTRILEANEDLFAYGTAKPTPQAKPFDVKFKPPENKPMSIEDVYSKISETSRKESISRGTPKLKQETLEIVPEKSKLLREQSFIAGKKVGVKPGATPLRFPKQTEFKISEETIKPSGGTITIQETAPSKFRQSSVYKGIESVERPLTSEEITILRSAEEATYPERYIPKVVRVGGISTLGSTEKIIHGELSTQKPIQIKMKDVGLGLKSRLNEQQVTGEIGKMRIGQIQEGKYESEQAQKLSSGLRFDVKQDMGISTKQEQIQLQRQAQRQEQIQTQATELKSRLITPREVITKKRIKIPPPFIIPREEEIGRRRIKIGGKKKQKFTSKPSKQDKGLLADWLSVTQSQARYGTATHPKLTAGTWSEAKQSGYMRVPTEELKRGGTRRNIFGNKRGNKNVFK